jgi:hypothetical protein
LPKNVDLHKNVHQKGYVMRRADRSVTDVEEIARILDQCTVVFLSFNDAPAPYVVPLFFGHEPGRLYVHCAPVGTKIDLLRADPRVGFSAVAAAQMVEGEGACDFTARAQSIAGAGTARIVDDETEKWHGLDLIMCHYAPRGEQGFNYKPASLSRTAVIAIEIQAMTAKRI